MNRIQWPADGSGWAYLAMTIGGGVSVYANVASKFVRLDERTKEWVEVDPRLDGVVLAACAPVLLAVMLEVLARVEGSSWADWLVRIGTLAVAAVAFKTSYTHLAHLLMAGGEDELNARVYPIGVDGAMVAAGAYLWLSRHTPLTAPVEADVTEAAPETRGEGAEPAPTSAQPLQPDPTTAAKPEPAPASPQPAPKPAAPKGGKRPSVDRGEIYRLADQGRTPDEIAAALDCHARTVRRHLDARTETPRLTAVPTERTGS